MTSCRTRCRRTPARLPQILKPSPSQITAPAHASTHPRPPGGHRPPSAGEGDPSHPGLPANFSFHLHGDLTQETPCDPRPDPAAPPPGWNLSLERASMIRPRASRSARPEKVARKQRRAHTGAHEAPPSFSCFSPIQLRQSVAGRLPNFTCLARLFIRIDQLPFQNRGCHILPPEKSQGS